MKDIFVARQPIFDRKRSVVGYELLYRSSSVHSVAGGASEAAMSSSVIVDGVVGVGLQTLTEGKTAFINLSEEMLLDDTADLLDRSSVVLELLESVRPTPEVVAKVEALANRGYRIALDDFVFSEGHAPLLELAHIVKVDVIEAGADLATLVEQVRPYGVELLAEKVENEEVHQRCTELGFSYFQGFHYFRPETLSRKDLSAQTVAIVRVMNMLQDPDTTDRQIEEAFRADPTLTYKLLRIVNSASLGGRGVQSIGHALRLLGREPLYRWMCLLMMTVGAGGGEMRLEMIKAALLRARMCEIVGDTLRSARNRDIPDGGSLFLVGLFSRIDQILGIPVRELLGEVAVTRDVRDALVDGAGKAGQILRVVEAYTDAEWSAAADELAQLGGDDSALPEFYLESLGWAADRLALHT